MQRCAEPPSESGHVCNLVISPARKWLANETNDSECMHLSCILTGKKFRFQPVVLRRPSVIEPLRRPELKSELFCQHNGTGYY